MAPIWPWKTAPGVTCGTPKHTRMVRSGASEMTRLLTVVPCLLALSLSSRAAFAAPGAGDAPAGASSDPAAGDDASAKVHFRKGIKLYQDGNYVGALAEFQASYRDKPAGSTLQNIALCQKELFRYAEAADSLAELLKLHPGELSESQIKSVRQTMDELEGLVGRFSVRVTPSHARVTFDGRVLTPEQLAEPIRANVGEHRFRADAPGYASVDQVVRVASGEAGKPLNIELRATKGFVDISASDAGAAIAIDRQPLAYHRYSGPIEPGKHLVQVYKEGHDTFEREILVVLGQTVKLTADIGKGSHKDIIVDRPGVPPPLPQEQRGWYVLGSLNALGVSANPSLLADDTQETGGGSFGVHGGYRMWNSVAIEGLLEGATHDVKACERDQVCSTDSSGVAAREYSLSSVRIGTNLRLFSSGKKLRFSGALGFGTVRQAVELKETDTSPGGKASGVDPYFMVELGAQYNAGHWLLGLAALGYFNGTSSISGDLAADKTYNENGLVTAGVGLRFGWSEWSSSPK